MTKRTLTSVVAVPVVLALLATGLTGGEELFDSKRSQREIEIMCGILRTSLDFAAEDLEGPFAPARWRSIDGFYLYGQGAVFVIPIPGPSSYGLRPRPTGVVGWSPAAPAPPAAVENRLAEAYVVESLAAMEAAEAEQAEVEAYLAELERLQEVEKNRKELAEQIEEAKARAQERKAEIERLERKRAEQLAEYRAQLNQLEEQLVETLAGHGDSLSQVAPDEYVTLVLSPDGLGHSRFSDESGQPARIVSVKKSTITAYKTGKLSEDAFRKAVLKYTN
jgi:hypothetical protein